jgi:hypothetical protein
MLAAMNANIIVNGSPATIDQAVEFMETCAANLAASAAKVRGETQSFRDRLRAAVKARTGSRNTSNKPQAAEQSFGEQLAAKAKQLARGRRVTHPR